MDLTAANTAIVVDSKADFPQAPERYPNWRIVPLYVRFGQESFRDYVELGPDDFYARLRGSPVVPTTSQPTPGDFHAAYEELGEYERVYSVHIAGTLSGTVESARTAAAEFGDPTASTQYQLCVYATTSGAPTLLFDATVPGTHNFIAETAAQHTRLSVQSKPRLRAATWFSFH